MGELAAFHQYLEICATAQKLVEKCPSSQDEVAILPTGVLPQDDRVLPRSYQTSMHPPIVLYSLSLLIIGQVGLRRRYQHIQKAIYEDTTLNAISDAIEEFGGRSKRSRC
jgi:hypothetical protein